MIVFSVCNQTAIPNICKEMALLWVFSFNGLVLQQPPLFASRINICESFVVTINKFSVCTLSCCLSEPVVEGEVEQGREICVDSETKLKDIISDVMLGWHLPLKRSTFVSKWMRDIYTTMFFHVTSFINKLSGLS